MMKSFHCGIKNQKYRIGYDPLEDMEEEDMEEEFLELLDKIKEFNRKKYIFVKQVDPRHENPRRS